MVGEVLLTVLDVAKLAYLAGLIDADGSIIIQFVPKSSYALGWYIKATIKIKQSSRRREYIINQKNKIGTGNIIPVKDTGSEFMSYELNEVSSIVELLNLLLPYLEAKRPQAVLTLELIEKRATMGRNLDRFLEVVDLGDRVSALNDKGRPRIWTGEVVKASFNPKANVSLYASASKLKGFDYDLWVRCDLNPALVLTNPGISQELKQLLQKPAISVLSNEQLKLVEEEVD